MASFIPLTSSGSIVQIKRLPRLSFGFGLPVPSALDLSKGLKFISCYSPITNKFLSPATCVCYLTAMPCMHSTLHVKHHQDFLLDECKLFALFLVQLKFLLL